jgi:hypothetical protein
MATTNEPHIRRILFARVGWMHSRMKKAMDVKLSAAHFARCDEVVGFEMPIKSGASFRWSVICATY